MGPRLERDLPLNLDWMHSPAVEQMFRVLGAPAVDVRLVGGCVRNAVMGLPIEDIDVGTPEIPDAVVARCTKAGVRVIPTGIEHGTVTLLIGDRSFEVTSLRRDTACDGRHADVEFTTDWAEDARRRDLTINAMSVRPDGALFDFFGGKEDALAGRVRFVGDPADRIQEDYLRILRLFRFFASFGRADIEPATLVACRVHAQGLLRLSAERIQAELVKILASSDPAPALAIMRDCGVLGVALPEARDLTLLSLLSAIERAAIAPPDWRRRLSACIDADDAEPLARRLKLSSADGLRLVRLTAVAPRVDDATSRVDLRAALYRFGPDVIRDRILLGWVRARTLASSDDAAWRSRLALVADWHPQSMPVSGADVLALGIPQGPVVGELLSAVESWWMARDFAPSREDALTELHRLAQKR